MNLPTWGFVNWIRFNVKWIYPCEILLWKYVFLCK